MKKLFLVVPVAVAMLVSCGGGDQPNNDALVEAPQDQNDFEDAALSFEEGGAQDGEQFFTGVQAEVIEIDVKFNEIEVLDEEDAPVEEFTHVLDTMLVMIENCKKAMALYDGKGWPKQQELVDLTIEWVDAMKGLVENHLRGLAQSLSTPDDKWKDKDFDLYEKYEVALEGYYEVDGRWVEFQDVYAEANGFSLDGGTIDVDALVEEDMNK